MCKGYKCVCYRKENKSEQCIKFSFEVFRKFENYKQCYYDASAILLDGLTTVLSSSCNWVTECGVLVGDYAQSVGVCRKEKEFQHKSEKYTYIVKLFCL